MSDMITISRVEYEALLEAREDLEDQRIVDAYLSNPQEGIPSDMVDRILDGESPLAVLRQWRGFSQSSLAKASGVNRVQISDIEAGRSKGSIDTYKKLADALRLTIDDIV